MSYVSAIPNISYIDKCLCPESLSLSSHSQLEYLRIWISTSPFSNHAKLFSACISQLLSPSLVCLRIGYFENVDPETFAALQSTSWKDVDDALGDPKFNRLTYFVMDLKYDYQVTLDRKTLRTTFRNVFPKSYQRGILWVTKQMGDSGRRGEQLYRVER